ncbi:uncharacterized protein N7479_011041 [Penicillium vulpinum]|uniref:Uncharacterized protein n=1 Tax=Penicillium vulpinum TaxID=29845 RepID=A0A1V6RT52_9EURO|nr:uncharacterized protein N7479_011041 [Penicillium vulpinum]KAJ5952628.1 hypothetical protein N7479_011041 [Penicillium vulpinum]OQE04806.1 hypothetical protein PENVUL_c029G02853 [Penicillium vulpinum]
MECFRQIFRCLKAPLRREKGKIIEIGPPTNFRKEELPTYFSDAESVLSPIQNSTERSDLTNQSQDAHVPGQPHNDCGEGRNDDRNGISTAIDEEQGAGPCSKDEHEIVNRLRERVKLSRWWKSNPAAGHETKAPAESIKMEEMQNTELACS